MAETRLPLILASGSKARQDMLSQCGLSFSVSPARIDETSLLQALTDKVPAAEIADQLAREKARAVGKGYPDSLVIGADQILFQSGEIFTKAVSHEEAAAKIRRLSGKTHQLISAVCVVHGGKTLFSAVDQASLTMKPLTETQIEDYLAAAGEEVLGAVGCYMLEALGPWLFDKIEGSYFTILGLPLLPLLGFLQQKGWGP